MIGLVFSFEDERCSEPVRADCSETSRATAGALAVAIQGDSRIHYEELTDRSNPHPKFAVIFSDLGLMDLFSARLTLALLPSGLRITSVRGIKDGAATQEHAPVLAQRFV